MKKNHNPRVIRFTLMTVLIMGAMAPAVYYHRQYQNLRAKIANPQAIVQDEVQKAVNDVGSLMVLPLGEVPTFATVSDKDKLTGQPFFINAQNGDKVLIYSKARRAILYRPTINKIIEVSTVNLGVSPAATSSAGGEK